MLFKEHVLALMRLWLHVCGYEQVVSLFLIGLFSIITLVKGPGLSIIPYHMYQVWEHFLITHALQTESVY